MADIAPGAIIFLVALFLAVVGATVLVVAVRRGMLSERPPDGDTQPEE